MEVHLKNAGARRLGVLLELAGLLVLSSQVLRTLAAERLGTNPGATIPDLELALRLDPDDARYHESLASLLRYSLGKIDLPGAMEHLKRAAELDPYSPQPWLDLGAALEFQGRIAEAETCLQRANALAPNLSRYEWVIGNFYLLHGNLPLAFQAFEKVLAGTSEYDGVLFDTAWKASGDGPQILRDLIPDRIRTEYSYLYYLTQFHHYPEAQEVWKRMASSSEPFPPDWAQRYLDELIAIHQPEQAYQLWSDLRHKGLIRPTYEQTRQNLIQNGDFEEDLLKFGFDWRTPPAAGAYVSVDRTDFHSPSHSVLIQFTGKENVDFQSLHQYVMLHNGGDYQFRAAIKTEGITTDSGLRFEIRDAYDPRRLDRFSENFVGDTSGWVPVEFNFTAGPDTRLVVVGVVRAPSKKLDNLIAGKAWVDDVVLVPVDTSVTEPSSGAKQE